jgi:hypothetical protein
MKVRRVDVGRGVGLGCEFIIIDKSVVVYYKSKVGVGITLPSVGSVIPTPISIHRGGCIEMGVGITFEGPLVVYY